MRLTRRGGALTATVVVGFVLAQLHGTRALGALVVPGAVALAAAVFHVWTVDDMQLTRGLPPRGQRGETGTVRLTVEGGGSALTAVRDALPAGLVGDGTVEVISGDTPATYGVRYAARGRHEIGPARVRVRDVLGLAEREFRPTETDALTVYPSVHPLSSDGHRHLFALARTDRIDEREEFDHLREYVQGDTLRDIHWKASAKRDDLVVTEYVASDAADRIEIAAEAATVEEGGDNETSTDRERPTDDRTPADRETLIDGGTPADAMAEAVASLALPLIDAGVPVALRTPSGQVQGNVGDRRRLLEHLAAATAGEVEDPAAAAVHVRATEADVRVRLGDGEVSFGALREGSTDASARVAGGDSARGARTEEVTP